MTQAEIVKIADLYAPNGIRDSYRIEEEMIISDSYSLYKNMDNSIKLRNVLLPLYDEQCQLIAVEEVNEAVNVYNWELITEWAFTKLTEDMDPEEFNALKEEELQELISENEMGFVDFLSYNGHLDDSYEAAKYLREEIISCTCSIDDDCVWGIVFPRDGDDEVTLNHCQIMMFDSLYDYQRGDREIAIFNMGSKYIHLASY